MTTPAPLRSRLRPARLRAALRLLTPGVLMAAVVAITAQFLAEHYATPAMLLALLLGIALGFLGEEGRTVPGIQFAARDLLRLGVALLGVRISLSLIAGLGADLIALIVGAVALTIGFGLLLSRFMKQDWRFGFLTAGSVAICGASAAVAIAAILPRDARSEERLAFAVMGVTVLSTLAMVAYPIIVSGLGMDDVEAGLFLGGTIHDVAQVVGAGFTISDPAGEAATLIKLFRVALLAPVVLIAALLIRRFAETPPDGQRPPLVPGFVIGFLALATLASVGVLPAALVTLLGDASRWLLLMAIAAVGMKTNLKQVLSLGGAAMALMVLETAFIGGLVLTGLMILR